MAQSMSCRECKRRYMSCTRPFRRGRLQLTRCCLRHHFHCKCFLIVTRVSIVSIIRLSLIGFDPRVGILTRLAADCFGSPAKNQAGCFHFTFSLIIALNCPLYVRVGQTSTKCCFPKFRYYFERKLKQMGCCRTKQGPPGWAGAKKQPNATSCFTRLDQSGPAQDEWEREQ